MSTASLTGAWTRQSSTFRRGAAITWTAVILVLCWIPARWLGLQEYVPDTGGFPLPPPDKLIHFSLFAGFSLLWIGAAWPRRVALRVLLAGLALAVLTELGQDLPFIARDGNLPDGLADSAGIVAGVVAGAWLSNRPTPSQPENSRENPS
jgi:hypothetical protein